MDVYLKDNGEFKKVSKIDESILLSDESLEEVSAIGSSIEMTFTGEIIDKDGLNVIRKIRSGGDRGIYNGLTLKEEGELSPLNAWL